MENTVREAFANMPRRTAARMTTIFLFFWITGKAASINLPEWDPSEWDGPPAMDPFSPRWPNSIAICGIMKEEELDDIEEWLAYHRWIGVDKVFLWEDQEVVPAKMRSFLQPWIDIGFLELNALDKGDIPYIHAQPRVYNRCSKPDMAGEFSWVLNIDIDEFVIILRNGKAVKNPKLKEVLTAFRNNAGVLMQSIMFGSSGHIERPSPGGALQHYSTCTKFVITMFKHLASSYWLLGIAVHNALYRFDDDPFESPVVRATGNPVWVDVLDEKHNKTFLDALAPTRPPGVRVRATRMGIDLNDPDHERHNGEVSPSLRMVLFHYSTKSQEDYFNRKLRLTVEEEKRIGFQFFTGLIDDKTNRTTLDAEWFQTYQANMYKYSDGICREAVRAKYAEAAREMVKHVRAYAWQLSRRLR